MLHGARTKQQMQQLRLHLLSHYHVQRAPLWHYPQIQ